MYYMPEVAVAVVVDVVDLQDFTGQGTVCMLGHACQDIWGTASTRDVEEGAQQVDAAVGEPLWGTDRMVQIAGRAKKTVALRFFFSKAKKT